MVAEILWKVNKMVCDKCGHEYEIGVKGAYKNFYGTRCPKCNHLIKPEQEAPFIRDIKEKKQALVNELLPTIREKLAEEINEEKKNAN